MNQKINQKQQSQKITMVNLLNFIVKIFNYNKDSKQPVHIVMQLQTKILIFFASAIIFGYGYGFDLPQSLEFPLRQQPYYYSNLDFNLLYFFTFLPVFLFQIPVGILIDKHPIKKSLYLFAFLCFASTMTAGLAFEFLFTGYKWVVNISRSIFGVSGYALYTIQAILIAHFQTKNYQVSIGICICLPFVFDALNSFVTTHVFDATKYMALTWYICGFVCFGSIMAAIWINKKYLSKMEDNNKEHNIEGSLQQGHKQKLLQNSSQTVESVSQINDTIKSQQKIEAKQSEHSFSFKSIKKLKSQFWVVCASIFFFQASLGPYFDNLNDMIVKRFGIDYTDAGKMLLIPQALLVFFGYGLAKICTSTPKYRRKILLVVSTLYFISITIMYLLPNTKNPSTLYYIIICVFLLLMSMMFACQYCALIGSTSYFVEKNQLGTSYGVAATALGTCQCLGPLVISGILNQYDVLQTAYQNLSLFGAGMAIFPIIFSLWMYYNLKDDFVQNRQKQQANQ